MEGITYLRLISFGRVTKWIRAIANRRYADLIVEITKSFYSLTLISAERQRTYIFGISYWGIGWFAYGMTLV